MLILRNQYKVCEKICVLAKFEKAMIKTSKSQYWSQAKIIDRILKLYFKTSLNHEKIHESRESESFNKIFY